MDIEGHCELKRNGACNKRLININRSEDNKNFFMFTLSPELFKTSNEIYILTYMFSGSILSKFLVLNRLPYERRGVFCDDSGQYHFTHDVTPPAHLRTLREKIHVIQDDKLNAIGNARTALSCNWAQHNSKENEGINQLRKNLHNYFCKRYGDIPPSQRLWCSFKQAETSIRGKGFWNRHIAFNKRATNDYRECTVLAYCVNVFLNPNVVQYFAGYEIAIDNELYALSSMIQWVFRSAIRDGEEIFLYVPSKRMRTLFVDWMDRLANGEPE